MSNREERRLRAKCRKATGSAAVKLQLRRSSPPHNLDITPEHLLSVAGPQCLHRRFLCGESPGKMDRWNAPPLTIGDFTVGEDAAEEPLAVPFDSRSNPRDIGRIETKANDGRH